MDPMLQRMADVLVEYCVGVQKGQWVVVQTSVLGEEIAGALQAAILRAGGYPQVLLSSERLQVGYLKEADNDQLVYRSPIMKVMMEQPDAAITVLAPANTRAMMSADPAKAATRQKAFEEFGEIVMRRTAEGTYKWTLAQLPTEAAAQDAQMSLEDYAQFVYRACLLEQDDPAAAWAGQVAMQQKLIDWITPRKTVHISGPGTDLTVGVAGRTWVNDEGKLNFPGGEIFTGPIENQTEGHIEFSFPAYLGGREVSGVRLVFEKGRVVEFSAQSGEDFLRAMLDMDEGARVLGEFAFGTNYGITEFTKNTLFDEKIGGTLHMALGRAYPDTGGTNISALHWDMVYDLQAAEVTVDGEPFSKNGQFQIL